MKIVVALGGNALSKRKVNYNEMVENLRKISLILSDLVKEKYKLVITHGSGPQAGSLLLQNELSKNKIPSMPLDVLDAEVQGQLGYLIERTMINTLIKKNLNKSIVTVLTQVIVDKKDPAFRNPTKPIGPFYTKSQLRKVKKKGITYKEDSGRGYRRYVPSPYPIDVVEYKIIKKLVNKGVIVIAVGGGGIPVYKEDKKLKGLEAVIDKDFASSLLATKIKADILLIITSIDKVYLNFRKKNKKGLNKVKLKDIKEYLKEGHFAEGSMFPKIKASIEFLERGGKKVIITNPKNVSRALKGIGGTIIEK